MTNKPDWSQFDFSRPTISNFKVETMLNCGLKYKLQCEDKLPTPPARALELGRCFDSLCETGGHIPDDLKLLTEHDMTVITERFTEYQAIMPAGKKQVPFQKSVDYKGWSIIGFIDLVPDEFPNAPIIEIKFNEEKWNSKKASYKVMQAATYAWALNHDWVQFHVMNFKEPGLQTFDMNIGEIETDRMLDDAVKAIQLIEDGTRKPNENVLCGWCDFHDHCPLFNTDTNTNDSEVQE